MSRHELESILSSEYSRLGQGACSRLADFYAILLEENANQNLTRLTGPRDFVEGHLVDALELIKSDLVDFPAMDLGSGGGSPGLIAGILGSGPWVLVDSEKKKAEFLSRAIEKLQIEECGAVGDRAENWLRSQGDVATVVARAVGPVDRIWGWIGRCSTWNKLVLLKSRGWTEEWRKFEEAHQGRPPLAIRRTHEYVVGVEQKYRIIVELQRMRG